MLKILREIILLNETPIQTRQAHTNIPFNIKIVVTVFKEEHV